MKLRRIGNSLGTTFSTQLLAKAGFAAGDELETSASRGEICIRRAGRRLVIELTAAQAQALARGDTASTAGRAVLAKARRALAGQG